MWWDKPKPRHVVLLGAGGHAAVVKDIFDAVGQDTLIGYMDDNRRTIFGGLSRLQGLDARAIATLPDVRVYHAVMGIGDNELRARLFRVCAMAGVEPLTLIHPSATISPSATIGKGTVVMAGVVVNAHATIGDNVILNTGCTVDHHCVIGDHAHVAPGVHLAGTVTVPSGTLVPIGTCVPPNRTYKAP